MVISLHAVRLRLDSAAPLRRWTGSSRKSLSWTYTGYRSPPGPPATPHTTDPTRSTTTPTLRRSRPARPGRLQNPVILFRLRRNGLRSGRRHLGRRSAAPITGIPAGLARLSTSHWPEAMSGVARPYPNGTGASVGAGLPDCDLPPVRACPDDELRALSPAGQRSRVRCRRRVYGPSVRRCVCSAGSPAGLYATYEARGGDRTGGSPARGTQAGDRPGDIRYVFDVDTTLAPVVIDPPLCSPRSSATSGREFQRRDRGPIPPVAEPN